MEVTQQWTVEDCPQTKYLQRGAGALNDSDLLANLLGGMSQLSLAKYIMTQIGGLDKISRCNINDLTAVKGVGIKRALQIVTAFELVRRHNANTYYKKNIGTSTAAYEVLHPLMGDLNHEEFHVLFLNRANQLIQTKRFSIGGINAALLDPRLVFRDALQLRACGIIISHNHPSGNLQPSEADKNITKKIKEMGIIMEVSLLDHIIITHSGFYSFIDNGRL